MFVKMACTIKHPITTKKVTTALENLEPGWYKYRRTNVVT